MRTIRVAPIVEGFGEVNSVRILLQRVWTEIVGGEHVDVLQPIRQPRSKLIRPNELERAIGLAVGKLAAARPKLEREFVLLMLDADADAVCMLGPRLLQDMRSARSDVDMCCVLPNLEYETWFVGAAESLSAFLALSHDSPVSEDPEAERLRKGWIEARFKKGKYSETVDQPALTETMDLQLCRKRCRSFDKLCREFERRLMGARPPAM